MMLVDAAKGLEDLLVDRPVWQLVVSGLVLGWIVLRILCRPRYLKSPDFYDKNKLKNLRIKQKTFPPPYPNGWVRVCSSEDIKNGQVKCISAMGTEFVAFRGKDGKAAVLHAYCPHLGAHLGKGGRVDETGSLVCPFHEWAFNTEGKATNIPYCRTEIPERAKTKAYPVHEQLGMIFIWFHAEKEKQDKPEWKLELLDDCDSDGFYYVTCRELNFDQHILEMHQNGPDYFHFATLHKRLPVPFLEPFLYSQHNVKARYFKDAVPDKPHLAFVDEKLDYLRLFGTIPLMPKWALDNILTTVMFEGPTIVHFKVETAFGQMRMIQTLLPVEPFKQHVEARWYAENTVPRIMAYLLSKFAERALNQDREVWENKIYHEKPMLVAGDGPFPAFKRYYSQFYSENSKSLGENELDW